MKIIDIGTDNCLIWWDEEEGITYNCGETLRSYGVLNLTEEEFNLLMDKHPDIVGPEAVRES